MGRILLMQQKKMDFVAAASAHSFHEIQNIAFFAKVLEQTPCQTAVKAEIWLFMIAFAND